MGWPAGLKRVTEISLLSRYIYRTRWQKKPTSLPRGAGAVRPDTWDTISWGRHGDSLWGIGQVSKSFGAFQGSRALAALGKGKLLGRQGAWKLTTCRGPGCFWAWRYDHGTVCPGHCVSAQVDVDIPNLRICLANTCVVIG